MNYLFIGKKIGITTSIPIEVIFASNNIPIDLNNLFITDKDPMDLVKKAEYYGFSANVCSWIKGLYAVAEKYQINDIIGVIEGDCSNTHGLIDIFKSKKINIIPFSFPYSHNYNELKNEIEKLMNYFNVDWGKVNEIKNKLDNIRKKIKFIDENTYTTGKVSGLDNHLFLVNCSDFNSDYKSFELNVDEFIEKIKNKPEINIDNFVKIGVIGVPTIFKDFYQFIEKLGAKVVFNEVQRQFSMIDSIGKDLVTQYLDYTYPYDVYRRIEDIKKQIKIRKIDGIIHYVQSFCFRQINDIVIRKELNVPILTLEGDMPINLDVRAQLKIETFVEMLRKNIKERIC